MSGSGAGEIQPQRKRRISPRRTYPTVDQLVDDLVEISTMTPYQLRRYSVER